MKSFTVNSLRAGYGRKEVLCGIDMDIPVNRISAIVGSNGCGKTTLLKCMANILKPFAGICRIDGKILSAIKQRDLAKRIACCTQDHSDCSYFTVRELVKMGRYPYGNESAAVSEKAVSEAMQLVNLEEFADCRLGELSYGTAHRAWLALALAQQPELLLLDEPTNFLDPLKKQQLAQTLKYLKEEREVTVVMVTHDTEFISDCADNVTALKEGRVIRHGDAASVFTADAVSEIYS